MGDLFKENIINGCQINNHLALILQVNNKNKTLQKSEGM
jgi:hypothetical protein